MSTTTVYLITKGGKLKEAGEFQNSHGWGPYVWSAVSEKYLGDAAFWLINGGREEGKKFWALWKDARLPAHWKAMMLMTFDWAVVERTRFKEMAEHIRKFVADQKPSGFVNHWPAFAEIMEQHANDKTVMGLCFWGTTLSENKWRTYDEETEKTVDHNFKKKGGEHWFVGRTLRDLERGG